MSGNLRTYETVVITKVDMPEETFKTLMSRCKTAITDLGKGEVVMEDDWGLANIAFEIKKEPRGRWTYLRYKAAPVGVDEVLRTLKINEGVLRYMTTRTEADAKNYETLRANMPKELVDRDKPRDWKEDRPRRGGGHHRGGGGFRRDRDQGGYVNNNNNNSGDVHAPAPQQSADAPKSEE